MTYQVLARKWRPRDFSSLVGQEHVVTALRNGLTEGRIAQAYLFSGIRGVGKTTAARVLAKALNCHEGPKADPCNECPSCVDINEGRSLNVIEIDAATYSKVEQIRELTETLRYGPVESRYKKVVVLDEVHRLSRQAFDALLKIVEEPPDHLVFIFATTEIDAVPATILSRCQEYQFRRVPSGVLAGHLANIAKAEGIEASDTALRLVARAGEGSVRDSVALLDQMATFGNGAITDEDAAKLLGGLDAAIFQKLLAGILEGDHGAILAIVGDIDLNGWDPNNVYSQFLSYTRDGLHLVMGGATQAVELPAEEADRLRELVRPHGYEALLQILQLLLTSESMIRRSEMGSLALEITWLRAAELPKVARIQDLLSGRTEVPPSSNPSPSGSAPRSDHGSGTNRGPESAPTRGSEAKARSLVEEKRVPAEDRVAPPSTRSETSAAAKKPVGEIDGSTKEIRARAEEANSSPLEISGRSSYSAPGSMEPRSEPAPNQSPLDSSKLPSLLEILGNRRQSLAALMSRAKLGVHEGELLICPAAGDSFLEGALQRDRNQKTLQEVMSQIWGRAVTFRICKPEELSGESYVPGESTDDREPWPSAAATASVPDPPEDPARHEPPVFWPPEAGEPNARPTTGVSESSRSPELASGSEVDTTGLPTVEAIVGLFGGKIQQIRDAREESPE